MSRQLSISERIRNAGISQEVENVKSRHAFLHARCDGATEFDQLWVHTDEIGWGHFFGCMVGFDQVWHGNITDYEKMGMERWMSMVDIYPEISGKDFRPLMECSVHTLVCDVIEVADDGRSARASFVTPGAINTTLDPDQEKWCHIMWERYGSDFVIDESDGQLKYLNEQVCPDIMADLDYRDWAAEEYARRTDPNAPPAPPVTAGNPNVTYVGPWHAPYSLLQPPQMDVLWPEPYETLDKDHRYNDPTKH